MSTQTPAKFVWHELQTTDVDAALKFYTELFGWTYKTGDMGPVKYHEIKVGDRHFGGITSVMSPGQPSAWSGYVTVDNVDAATQRAERAGGKVVVPPMDIPHTGRFAFIADPAGAMTGPFSYSGQPDSPEPEGPPALGTFCWNELMTADVQGAQRFYGELYGWTCTKMDMGGFGTYHMFRHGDKDIAGMMQKPPQVPVSFWLYYVAVADVDASFKKAQSLGARPFMPPADIPNIGRFAVAQDPTGGVIALFAGKAG